MLIKAANLHNIDLKKSWIVGDRYTDIKAGRDVGTKTILLQTGHLEKDFKNKVTPNKLCKDLEEAVKYILKEEK